jgi:anion-transporting  ArsA/GET3 family ATPase
MADFFSSRLLRWLIAPSRSRLVTAASKPFYSVADRILGSQFLADIAEFFVLFQTMYDGFVERAEAVTRLLSDRRTTFLVVSTLEEASVREAEFFMDELRERQLHLGALVLNKVLPSFFGDEEACQVATRLVHDHAPIAERLTGAGPEGATDALGDPAQVSRVLREIGQSFLDYRVVATREREQAAELGRHADMVVAAPYLDHDVADLGGLLALGRRLW